MNSTEARRVYGSSKKGMITLLTPIIMAIGSDIKDKDIWDRLDKMLQIQKPSKTSNQDILESMFFGMLAIKKYGASVEEVHKLIMEMKIIVFCFDKLIDSGEAEAVFKDIDAFEAERRIGG